MKKPWIQVSVDTQDLDSARFHVEHAIAMDAEWVEVGTPLLTFAGINAIKVVADMVPDRKVLADFKALDGVAQYFTHTGELGGSIATVMAVANDASIIKAIESGHAAGVKVQVDMLGLTVEEMIPRAKEIAAMGADYFLLHLAIDELLRNPEADPLAGLDELVQATEIPIGPVVFSKEQGVDAIKRGASYLVIGYPLITMPDAREKLLDFADTVRNCK